MREREYLGRRVGRPRAQMRRNRPSRAAVGSFCQIDLRAHWRALVQTGVHSRNPQVPQICRNRPSAAAVGSFCRIDVRATWRSLAPTGAHGRKPHIGQCARICHRTRRWVRFAQWRVEVNQRQRGSTCVNLGQPLPRTAKDAKDAKMIQLDLFFLGDLGVLGGSSSMARK